MESKNSTRSLIVPLTRSYLCDTKPPVAKEFNNRETSDLEVHCGERTFHVHRLILASASPVFRRMLDGQWRESQASAITLHEEAEELMEPFLNFLYSGHIIMLSSNIVRFYTLADKYHVQTLSGVCRRHILDGLAITAKVVEENDRAAIRACPHREPELPSEVVRKVTYSEVADWFSALPLSHCYRCRLDHLSAAMHFGLPAVVELASCPCPRLARQAYLSLLVSLLKLRQSSSSWASACALPLPLLLSVLQDNSFAAREDDVFDLAFEWLQSNAAHCPPSAVTDVLCSVRLPLMSREGLYRTDALLRRTPWIDAKAMETLDARLRTAERYQLFAGMPEAASQEDWTGAQFTYRNGCDVFQAVVTRKSASNSQDHADAD